MYIHSCTHTHIPWCSGVELYLQHDPRVINHIEINDGNSALHIVSRIGDCDQLCFLAAVVYNIHYFFQ